jgi:hypothetical protein
MVAMRSLAKLWSGRDYASCGSNGRTRGKSQVVSRVVGLGYLRLPHVVVQPAHGTMLARVMRH